MAPRKFAAVSNINPALAKKIPPKKAPAPRPTVPGTPTAAVTPATGAPPAPEVPQRTYDQYDPNAHDSTYEAERTNLDLRTATRRNQLEASYRQGLAGTAQGRNTAAFNRAEQVRTADSNAAGRGFARSGMRDLSLARAGTMYQQALDAYNQQDSAAASEYQRQLQQTQADYNDEMLAAAQRKRSRWLEGLN